MRLSGVVAIASFLVTTPARPAAGQQPRWLVHEWDPHQDTTAWPSPDPGIGVVYFAADLEGPSAASPDSVPIYADSSATSRLVGALQRVARLLAPERLRPNWVEFGYEVAGVPVERVSPSGRWAEVLYGFTPQGQVRRGWVRLVPDQVELRLWADELREHGLYFLSDSGRALYDRPNVRPQRVPWLAHGREGHLLHPLEVRGDWMRVRAVSPSDICGEAPTDSATGWIRFRTATGRPRVWYYSRGC